MIYHAGLIADEPRRARRLGPSGDPRVARPDCDERLRFAVLMITHNLPVVSAICDRTAVMNLGRIVEDAPTAGLLPDPRCPYARPLVATVPRIAVTAASYRRP
jgi:ABC-type dipeptide/oligopeptide/nickel transport system ATPase component